MKNVLTGILKPQVCFHSKIKGGRDCASNMFLSISYTFLFTQKISISQMVGQSTNWTVSLISTHKSHPVNGASRSLTTEHGEDLPPILVALHSTVRPPLTLNVVAMTPVFSIVRQDSASGQSHDFLCYREKPEQVLPSRGFKAPKRSLFSLHKSWRIRLALRRDRVTSDPHPAPQDATLSPSISFFITLNDTYLIKFCRSET